MHLYPKSCLHTFKFDKFETFFVIGRTEYYRSSEARDKGSRLRDPITQGLIARSAVSEGPTCQQTSKTNETAVAGTIFL